MDESNPNSPLSFYSDRITHFDTERRVFAEYLALVSPNPGELHILEWDCKQQEDSNDLRFHIYKIILFLIYYFG